MKTLNPLPGALTQKPIFWLTAIGACLVAVQLTVAWRADATDHLGMSLLFWVAIASLLHEKQETLKLESSVFASLIGALIIGWVLLYSTSLPGKEHSFLYLAPFISGLGLAIVASGFSGLKQYWQALVMLFFLGIPRVLLKTFTDLSPLTAKFSSLLLWYSGQNVVRDGVYIRVLANDLQTVNSSVEVYEGCSGIEAISYLVGLAAVFLVMFPLSRGLRWLVPIVAVAIAFGVNGIRVALMAMLAGSNQAAFDYWHVGDGSMIFAMTSVTLFGIFCFFLLKWQDAQNIPREPTNAPGDRLF